MRLSTIVALNHQTKGKNLIERKRPPCLGIEWKVWQTIGNIPSRDRPFSYVISLACAEIIIYYIYRKSTTRNFLKLLVLAHLKKTGQNLVFSVGFDKGLKGHQKSLITNLVAYSPVSFIRFTCV